MTGPSDTGARRRGVTAWVGAAVAVGVVLAAAGCGGGTAPAAHRTTSTTAAPLPCGGAAALPAAVRTSPTPGLVGVTHEYVVANVSLARSDPTWARFDTLPAAGEEHTYRGGFGLAHCAGTVWTVTAFGTAEVGCPGGTVPPPPPAVRADLGIDCP